MHAYHVMGPAPLYTNTFLLIADGGHAAVIDPAAPVQEYEQLLAGHNATLTHIFCTHGHYDHVGSAAALRSKWGAALYCQQEDVQGSQMYPLASADCGYTDGGVIQLDELRFTVWCTPGHTPGGVCLLLDNYFFTGDTLFAGSIGRTDLPGGDMAQMNASLRKLAALPLPPQAQVLPGHGEFSTFGQELAQNWYMRAALRG